MFSFRKGQHLGSVPPGKEQGTPQDLEDGQGLAGEKAKQSLAHPKASSGDDMAQTC